MSKKSILTLSCKFLSRIDCNIDVGCELIVCYVGHRPIEYCITTSRIPEEKGKRFDRCSSISHGSLTLSCIFLIGFRKNTRSPAVTLLLRRRIRGCLCIDLLILFFSIGVACSSYIIHKTYFLPFKNKLVLFSARFIIFIRILTSPFDFFS